MTRRRYSDEEVEAVMIPKIVEAIYPVLLPMEQQDCAIQEQNHKRITEIATKVWREFTQIGSKGRSMTEDQIKHMVDRFLGWHLPENFNPDGGIIFKPMFNEHTSHPMRHDPSGTNLFDAEQATAMVRFMVDGMP